MARCSRGMQIHNFKYYKAPARCNERTAGESLYCELHLAEALARVALVRDDGLKPWTGVVRASAMGGHKSAPLLGPA